MTLQDCSLVARSGQGLRLAVHSRYPAADGLDPLAVIDAARVRHIGKGAGGQAAHGGTIEMGGLHLGKARGAWPNTNITSVTRSFAARPRAAALAARV